VQDINRQTRGRSPAIRIVIIADTHELHRQLEIPPGDMLIHAGDFSNFGKQTPQLRDFNEWLGELTHPYKLIVPGNHEFALEEPKMRDAIYNAQLLIGEGVEIGGLRIWGSPAVPHSEASVSRLEMTRAQKRNIERAASLRGTSVTHFILNAVAASSNRDDPRVRDVGTFG
jgi:Calcineurin-like phosphoesterase/Protein of unknown function (DUF1778)